MKKILTTILLIILIVSLSTGMIFSASATSGPSVDYPTFRAAKYAGEFESKYIGGAGASYARNFLDGMKNDVLFKIELGLWDGLHIASDPMYSLESGRFTKYDYYKTVLFDLLMGKDDGSAGATFEKLYDEVNNSCTKFIASTAKEIASIEKVGIGSLINVTHGDYSELLRISRVSDFAENANDVSEMLEHCKNMYDAIKVVGNYIALTDLNNGTREVLNYIANDPANPADLRAAAQSCILCFGDSYQTVINAMLIGECYILKDVASMYVDYAWGAIVESIPGGAAVLLTLKGGIALVNCLMSEDDKIAAYYQIEASVICEDALISAMRGLRTSASSNREVSYMRAVEMYKSTVLLGFDYSVELLNVIYNTNWNLILGWYDDALTEANNIKTLKDSRIEQYASFEDMVHRTYIEAYFSDYSELLEELNDQKLVPAPPPPPLAGWVSEVFLVRDGDNYTVTDCNSYASGILEIPEYYYGLPVTVISDWAFYSCKKLTRVTIPDSVTSIGNYAFANCDGLTRIVIPKGITNIGYFAFEDCDGLTSVTISSSVTNICGYAFGYCQSLTGIWVDKNNPNYSSDEFGVLFNKDKTVLIRAPQAISGSYAFPDSVTLVCDEAFSECHGLTSVIIPDSLTHTLGCAFIDCDGLMEVHIPDIAAWCRIDFARGVSGFNAGSGNPLYYGASLYVNGEKISTELTIPYGVDSIGDYAFVNCDSLINVIIPDSVTAIGRSAFEDCTGLTSVTIGNGVTAIGGYAFYKCSGLTDVYYAGTQGQWNAIETGDDNVPLLNATLRFVQCEINGHTEEIVPGKAATCTTAGLTEGKKCSICGEILVAQETVPALEHTYRDFFDADCDICGAVREAGVFKFENYRVVFSDSDTTHKNPRVVIYKLGDQTVTDPTNEKALQAIDANAVTKWGERNINRILLTDAGNYVLLLKYNVGTGAATVVPMQISVSADPKLIIDENNKITVIDNDDQNTNHRAVVYYLGKNTVEDIYDTEALKAIDPEAKTHWQKLRINRLALTKGGNYVLHLEYNVGTEKRTVAQLFTVFSIPNLKVDQNNMLVATEENSENKNHRVTVFYLGDATVEDPFDETAVKGAAISSKTYWGLSSINKVEITEGGNYVIHLYYNVGTSAKRTLALDVTLNDRPELSVDENNKLVVAYTDPAITNPRAYIYNIGDETVEDIYDEAALEAIATPAKVWGLSAIAKKTLTPGTYVIHFHYNVAGSEKKTVAIRVTI